MGITRTGPLALAALAIALAACSGTAAQLPSCMTGTGSDGSTSVLMLRQDGSAFSGTYVNTPRGAQAGIRYDVTGHLDGASFTSLWSAGGATLTVTGHWDSHGMVLDNPGRQYATDHFRASSACP